jgi:hypothetical protein
VQRRAHALARFLHLGLRKPDDLALRQPAANVRLDAHQRCLETRERAAIDDGEGHARSTVEPPLR